MKNVEIRKPPIEMRHHFFPAIHVEADIKVANLDPSTLEFGCDFKIDLKVGEFVKEHGAYPLQLTIEACEVQGKTKGYDVKVTAVGYVVIATDVPEEKKIDLLTINGGSLLYSATREYLYSVTLRGPFPPIYLPTVSFAPKEESKPAT